MDWFQRRECWNLLCILRGLRPRADFFTDCRICHCIYAHSPCSHATVRPAGEARPRPQAVLASSLLYLLYLSNEKKEIKVRSEE